MINSKGRQKRFSIEQKLNTEILIRFFFEKWVFLWMRRIFQIRNWQRCLRHQCMTWLNGNYRHQYIQWIHEKTNINLSMIKITNAKRSICAGLRQYFNVAQHIKQTASLFHQQNCFEIYRILSFSFKIHQKASFWLKIYRKSIYLTKKPWIWSKPQKNMYSKPSVFKAYNESSIDYIPFFLKVHKKSGNFSKLPLFAMRNRNQPLIFVYLNLEKNYWFLWIECLFSNIKANCVIKSGIREVGSAKIVKISDKSES